MNAFPWVDFVIFCYPRTGSNWLCSMLASLPGIVMHHELLRKEQPDFHPRIRDSAVYGVSAAERDRDIPGFLRRVKDATPDATVGFKIFPWHGHAMADDLCTIIGLKKIILYRANVLAVYASLKTAELTGRYVSREGGAGEGGAAVVRPPFDAEAFEDFRREYDRWYGAISEAAFRSGPAVISVYETLRFLPVFQSVSDFVAGVVVSSMPATPHRKSGALDVAARFDNREHVLAYIEQRDLHRWRYD